MMVSCSFLGCPHRNIQTPVSVRCPDFRCSRNFLSDFMTRLFQLVMRIVFWLFAAIAVSSLLAVALVLVVLSLLRALITGKRPTGPMVFGRFQQFSSKGMWPGAKPPPSGPPSSPLAERGRHPEERPRVAGDDVVDVEVRDITPDKPQP
jgi:hypothetical protein